MNELVVIIPSKGRPTQAARLVEQIAATTVLPVRTVIVVPLEDPVSLQYEAVVPLGTPVVFDSSGCHVGAINAGATWMRQTRPYAYVKMDDDHWPVTFGWDQWYVHALRQLGSGIVYGNDLLQGESLPTAPGLTADVAETLGYVAPPCLRHLYCDNYWRDLGRDAGCLTYLSGVIIEHRHFTNGKSPIDDTYRYANTDFNVVGDRLAYSQFKLDGLFDRDVELLRSLRKR